MKHEIRKCYVFKNTKTGVIENFYGTSTEVDVHIEWHPELYCIEVKDI